jgi:fatty acid-binding protein DegV
MLNVKPLITITKTGRLVPVGKARGRNKAITQFIENIEKYDYIKNETIYIAHSDDIELAQQLSDAIRERYGVKDIVVNDIGPVIGAHVGPSTLCLIFLGNGERMEVE